MDDPIVSRIIDLLQELCKGAFSGLKGKLQLFNIKRRLKNQIFNEILSKYGDSVFYNELDHFLTENDVICNIIRNCCDTAVFHYKSKSQTIDYYVQLFVEQHPKHRRYHYEIRNLLQRYFEVIYLALNKSNNNETRIVCNVAKELAHGLLDELQNIKHAVDQLDKKVDGLVNEPECLTTKFLLDEYGIDDISQEDYRKKFYAEFNNFVAQYNENYFFITSRFNRYHGELGEKKQYFLTALSEQTIRQELRSDGIVVDIPRHYYMLFSNPFFLSVGKSVLKKSTNRDIFNRSRLFEELFQKLYGGMSQQGQFAGNIPLTYHDAQNILGDFAYHTFSQPSYSYTEFDQQLSKIVHENKMRIIGSFVGSGLFRIEDKVVFVHKLLKEYCVAYYLVHNFPLSSNAELYMDLIEKAEWKEVFIFAGGVFKEAKAQDEFLDFVMEHNLPLYIECVNAKSDVSESDATDSAKRLLTQIHNTVLSEYILPGPDIPASGACFTWDLYSKEQKERRIAQFFYYHEISYLSMVEYNFPRLKKHFRRYNDTPYQVVVEVDHNENANPHDFTSEPSIQYYYIASPTKDIPMPIICQTKEKAFANHEQIMQTIQESYLKQGRTANRLTTTRTGFTFTTTSRRTGGDNPLSDYVYNSIKESLEDVFGAMR